MLNKKLTGGNTNVFINLDQHIIDINNMLDRGFFISVSYSGLGFSL